MKRTLASTWSAWQNLHGEIYYDDLLVINTIKNSSSELFHFIVNNLDQLRVFADAGTKADNAVLYDAIEQILNKHNTAETLRYHILIQFLFPGWKIRSEDNASRIANYMYAIIHPQGIASNGNINYFIRAFVEEVGDGEPHDQAVMNFLLEFNEGKVSPAEVISSILDSENFADRVEYFGKLLAPAKVLMLTSEYFKLFSNKIVNGNIRESELTGRLWRMSLDNPEIVRNHNAWLESQIDIYLPMSLQIADEIFYYWKFRDRNESSTKQYSTELHKMYLMKVTHLIQNSSQLVQVLKNDLPHIWKLRHIVFHNNGNDTIKQSADSAFFSDWQTWFVEALTNASQEAPTVIAMYAIPLVYDIKNEVYDHFAAESDSDADVTDKLTYIWRANFDEVIGKMLFGENLPKIMQIIAVLTNDDYTSFENLDEQTKTILDYAVVHAKQWLQDPSET